MNNNYKCPGQMNITEFITIDKQQHKELVVGECSTCAFWRKNLYKDDYHCAFCYSAGDKVEYFQQKDGRCWLPGYAALDGCCASCKWSNVFIYQGEDIRNPIDEPNIYCTHPEGSLNRECVFKEFTQEGFGIGLWHRQHEYDTCDRYESRDKKC